MKRILLIFWSIILIGALILGEKASAEEALYWAKAYGGSDWDDAYAVAVAPNGDIIVVGETESFGAGQEDVWVLRLDEHGNVKWQKTYGGSDKERANAVVIADNGDIIVVGSHEIRDISPNRDIWVLRLDKNGNLKWQRTYESGSDRDGAYGVAVAPNNDIIVTGSFTMRLDANGNVIWAKDIHGNTVAIEDNGDIIVATSTRSFGTGSHDVWVLRLDENGNVKWSKTYGGSDWDNANAVAVAPNDDIIVAGHAESFTDDFWGDVWVLRLDENGNVKWEKTYGGDDSDYVEAVTIASNGDIIVAGDTHSFGTGSHDVWVLKLPPGGSLPSFSKDSKATIGEPDIETRSLEVKVLYPEIKIMTSQAIIQDSNATVTTIIGPGTLEISSSPSGAKIYVNGEYKGVTPLTLSLMPGTYEVRITKDGYEDYTGMVGVKTGETRSISVTLKPVYGFLSVNSNPPGAEVYINGNYAGTTPLEDYKLSPGEYEVKIKKDGYEEYSKIVTITAGKTTTFSALLTPIPQSSSTTTSITSTTSSTSPTPSSSPTSTSKTSPQTATSSTSPRETSTAVSSSNLNPYYIVGALIGLLLIGGIVSKTKSRKSKKAEKPEKLPETMEKTPRYEALGNYLSKLDKSNVTLKFDEIERIIGGKLPDSARKHRAWWGNDRSHSHAVKGWLNAGWKVKRVDFERGLVEFERSTRVEVKKPEEQPTQEIKKPALLESLVLGFPSALLERYEPLEFLGEGGFAKVFKVKRKSDGKVVALKIPRIDEKTSKTFIKEVSTWLHLNHPNIVKLYDVDILPIPYLEMEYVEGVNMNGKTIRDLGAYPKPVDEKTALKLIRSIAEGLKYAHGKGIYHRDLKPLNILLKSDLMPKITDWGLAKLGTMSSRRSVLGYTPLYASPEHLMPSKYGHTDHRTDIWQLGVTFYELLTGKLPFEGYTYEEVFGKIVDEGYRFTPPSKINPALAKYDGIFEKLLAKRKENRYQSVDELLKDLEKLEEAEKRKKQLEKEVEKLRETLSKSVQALKRSTTPEEALRNRRLVVETLGKLVLAYAELNNKAELLNTLNDLKFYTVQNLADLTSAINAVALLIREGLPVSEDFMERLKVLVHNIKRENGA